MITVEVSARLTVDELLMAVAKLPAPELATFVRRAMAIQAQRGVPLLHADEEQLLLQVIANQRLSEVEQKHLDGLREKSRSGVLSPSEQAELLAFVQQVERQDLTRVQAFVELARKRGTTLDHLLHDLGLEAVHA